MKLKLTIDEAKTIILNHLGLSAETLVVITSNPQLDPKINRCLLDIEKLDYKGKDKISGIRILRDAVNDYGLVQTKWAVEHWKEFSTFVRKHRRWPKIDGIYPNMFFK